MSDQTTPPRVGPADVTPGTCGYALDEGSPRCVVEPTIHLLMEPVPGTLVALSSCPGHETIAAASADEKGRHPLGPGCAGEETIWMGDHCARPADQTTPPAATLDTYVDNLRYAARWACDRGINITAGLSVVLNRVRADLIALSAPVTAGTPRDPGEVLDVKIDAVESTLTDHIVEVFESNQGAALMGSGLRGWPRQAEGIRAGLAAVITVWLDSPAAAGVLTAHHEAALRDAEKRAYSIGRHDGIGAGLEIARGEVVPLAGSPSPAGGEFVEDDEPLADVLAAFDAGEKVITARPTPQGQTVHIQPAVSPCPDDSVIETPAPEPTGEPGEPRRSRSNRPTVYDARLEELSAFARWAASLDEDGHPDLRAGLSMSQIAEWARAAFRGQRAPDWAYNVAPEPTGEPVPASGMVEPTRAEELAPEFPAPAGPGYDGAKPASTGFGLPVPADPPELPEWIDIQPPGPAEWRWRCKLCPSELDRAWGQYSTWDWTIHYARQHVAEHHTPPGPGAAE